MYRLVTIEICIGWLPQGFLYSLVTIMYNMVTIGVCIPFSLLIFVQFSIHWVLYTFFSSVYRLVLGSKYRGKKENLACFLRGAVINRERVAMARVRYLFICVLHITLLFCNLFLNFSDSYKGTEILYRQLLSSQDC